MTTANALYRECSVPPAVSKLPNSSIFFDPVILHFWLVGAFHLWFYQVEVSRIEGEDRWKILEHRKKILDTELKEEL
jgi:hypothetical protein